MARSMDHDGGYRAVVKIKTLMRNGNTGQVVDGFTLNYFGPWDRAATAKAEVTKSRKYYGKEFVDGWIEQAEWRRVD